MVGGSLIHSHNGGQSPRLSARVHFCLSSRFKCHGIAIRGADVMVGGEATVEATEAGVVEHSCHVLKSLHVIYVIHQGNGKLMEDVYQGCELESNSKLKLEGIWKKNIDTYVDRRRKSEFRGFNPESPTCDTPIPLEQS
ncbi:hypothetical protein M378DRAFT_177485 [Amanita muscaria Koide BX008]|uniref:Uncharacterized protein n=1 Tax=Amanita muscaria (strain Koide BX008) TaxID=946122 RepID=A0A0C2TIZ0_AMAMK|nr:hypothetical protein M378DRAFT_177485 [Amanita muscaria Koide BX008]